MSDDEKVERDEPAEESERDEPAEESERDEPAAADPVEDIDEEEEERLRGLLRGALEKEEPRAAPDVLRGVQRRLRDQSGGKFYADGWSTARHPPVYTYLVTSLLMLGIVFVVYVTLGYLDGLAHEVENAPAPVHVIPPRQLQKLKPPPPPKP